MWRILSAWLVMLLVSVANGAARDFTYGRSMDELSAHQLSTLSSILLLGMVMRAYVWLCPPVSARQAILTGLAWLALTVAFEFLFFHYAGGHSWSDLLGNYNVLQGRIWVLVPVWIGVGPYVFFRAGRPA